MPCLDWWGMVSCSDIFRSHASVRLPRDMQVLPIRPQSVKYPLNIFSCQSHGTFWPLANDNFDFTRKTKGFLGTIHGSEHKVHIDIPFLVAFWSSVHDYPLPSSSFDPDQPVLNNCSATQAIMNNDNYIISIEHYCQTTGQSSHCLWTTLVITGHIKVGKNCPRGWDLCSTLSHYNLPAALSGESLDVLHWKHSEKTAVDEKQWLSLSAFSSC